MCCSFFCNICSFDEATAARVDQGTDSAGGWHWSGTAADCRAGRARGADRDGLTNDLAHRDAQGQYVVNVPEGLSKLVLEHKCRPDASLKAAICLGNPAVSTVRVSACI